MHSLSLVYLVPLVILWLVWTLHGYFQSRRASMVLEDNRAAGLGEPSSLHPVIDPARCLGCAACVRACPEKSVLGIFDGRAVLVEPTLCVGHGACATACPLDAITLVFGSETRGVDIPVLTPEFETSIPGIFIAGELGGMGLVKNAVEQGRQAMVAIARRLRDRPASPGALDVLIVGCGPAGIAASLGAEEAGLSFETLDQSTLGGTVAHFPRGKLVMTAPADLPLVGRIKFSEIGKEALVAFWEEVIATHGLLPRFAEQVTGIHAAGDHFRVVSSRGEYRARCVLLAIGRRGTPRPLNVPGEELDKVTYRLIDPEQYRGRRVLVVGGGDSALEAATSIAEQEGSKVTLSYRGEAYGRARRKNRERLANHIRIGAIDQRLCSTVVSIGRHDVILECEGELETIPNDDVIICAGGIMPHQFLQDIGIEVQTKFGTV